VTTETTRTRGPSAVNTISAALKPQSDFWAWQAEGLCKDEDSEVFFLDPNMRGDIKRLRVDVAKSICNPCPVKKECLEHALAVPENYGVWGGLSEEERANILHSRGFKPEYTRLA
jgi:WhiB family redox-sensing transcriptional regulator